MSSPWKVALFLLAALAAVLGPAAPAVAQGGQKVFQVEIEAGEPPKIDTDLGSATVFFNITVRSTQPPNGLTDSFRHDVTLTLTAPRVDGWNVGTLSETSFSLAKAGDKKMVRVTVKVTMHNPPEDQVQLTLKAVNKPVFQGQSNPLTDQLVQNMGQASDDDEKVTVKRDLKGSEAVIAFAKQNRIILLALAGGLLVLGVLFAKRKKGGLSVSSSQPALEVLPGRGASFPVQIANESKRRQKVNVATSDVPPGWAAILPVESLDLNGGEATTLWVTVKAPATARPGENVKLNFLATGDDASEAAEQMLEARVSDRPEPVPPPEPEPTPPAEPIPASPPRRPSARRR